MAFGYLGAVQFWHGNWKAAINNCNQCIAVSRRLDNPLPIIWATLFRGAALFNLGDRERGLAVMGRSIEIMAGTDSVLALRFFYALYAECLAVNGNYQKAELNNRKAMALGQSGQRWGEIAGCRTQAILAAASDDPDWSRVEALMRESIEMAEKSGAATELALSIHRNADLMRSKGDEAIARAGYR
jgi:hypothetical protein